MNSIIEIDENQSFDVFEKLAKDRTLFINGEITDTLASEFVATLLVKNNENKDPITIFINSPGGNIIEIFSIYDIMMLIESPINTIATGEVWEGAALLLAAGTDRYATENSTVVLSQLTNGYLPMYSSLVDTEIFHDRNKKLNDKFLVALSMHTGVSVKKLTKELERPKYLTPDQAINYGVIDNYVSTK